MKKIKKNRLTLSKYKFLFKFLKRSLRKGGRNNYGRITVRAQGGGVKQLYRTVNFKRNFKNGVVSNLDYDPNRSAYLAKIISINEQEKGAISYILAPKGLKIFDRIQVIENKRKNYLLRPGDVSILANFEIGDFIHCVEMIKGRGGLFARAAGTFCQILENLSSFVKIKLPSGSRRLFSSQVKASYGVISRENYNLRILEKAGCNRWRNKRSSVGGVAMNPVDHPHGGGQGKTKGGRPSVTPKSRPTKGQPTRNPRKKNSMILQQKK